MAVSKLNSGRVVVVVSEVGSVFAGELAVADVEVGVSVVTVSSIVAAVVGGSNIVRPSGAVD